MVAILVVSLGETGKSLIDTAKRIVGDTEHADFFRVGWQVDLDAAKASLSKKIKRMNRGAGVLLLTDMFGGTAANLATALEEPGHVEALTGVNLPMVVKALTLPESIKISEAAQTLVELSRQAIKFASELG